MLTSILKAPLKSSGVGEQGEWNVLFNPPSSNCNKFVLNAIIVTTCMHMFIIILKAQNFHPPEVQLLNRIPLKD